MAELEVNKKRLQELREAALAEAKTHNFEEMTHEQKEAWVQRNEEMETLAKSVKEQQEYKSQVERLEADVEAGKEVKALPIHEEVAEDKKTVAQRFHESKAVQSFINEGMKNVTSEVKWNPILETKTLVDEGSAYPPSVVRSDLIVPTALRNPNSVIDLFSVLQTDQYQYKYLEETTFTNNAAEVAEASAFGESALAMTERTEEIRKFGVSIPVTEELLADVTAVQGYLDSRLRTMLNLRLDSELLNGDGTAPNIEGVLNKSGINTFDYSAFTGNLKRIGQVYQAITEIRKDAFVEPDAILMHPSDWYDIVTEVNAVTTSGALNPLFMGAGMFNGAPQASLWGVPVVPTTAISAGTALVGNFGGGVSAHIVTRQGIDVAMSDSHSDFFTKDKVMMKASLRLGFAIYRPTAFCSITNF
jgi:HK97 family phage major capsid protein